MATGIGRGIEMEIGIFEVVSNIFLQGSLFPTIATFL